MYDAEHIVIMKSIRNGEAFNNGASSINSTAMAIMGRVSSYTGKKVTWEAFMDSKEDLSPPSYDLTAAISLPEVAKPGITPFI